MQDFRNSTKQDLEQVIAHMSNEIALLHSSRATPAMVEDIPVLAYGQRLPLKQVASLSAPDARTILVQPWDASALQDIQKAIELAHVGLSMSVEEKHVRLTMPQLSEERRNEMIKLLGKKTEEARIAARQVRERVQKTIEEAFRSKEISEDEKFRSKDALQKLIDEANGKIDALYDRKAKEIAG